MKIRIYQINSDRDVNRVLFEPYERLEKYQGSSEVDSKIYDKIYDKEVKCRTLEDVFAMFNMHRPEDFKGHSLSISDVVEVYESDSVKNDFYFCDTFGYKTVEFNPAECEVSERINEQPNKISVLLIEPHKAPALIEIDDSYEALVEAIGGELEEYTPFNDDVAIVCNLTGKQTGAVMNRAIYSEPEKETDKQEIRDVIFGKFLVCYAPIDSETYLSLPEDLAKKYKEKFKNPERFFKEDGRIVAVPYKPKDKDHER